MTKTVDIQTEADQHYRSRFGEIDRLIRIMGKARDQDHDGWADDIDQRLRDGVLAVDLVEIRPLREECDWSILLGTGGPADRVLVTTDYRGEVESASYQYQDWFTPWTDARGQDTDAVVRYAETFYFGSVTVVRYAETFYFG